MKHQIINLVIPMHKRAPVLWLRLRILEERHHLVEVRDLADGNLGLDVDGLRLRQRDGAERRELPVVEAGGLAEGGEVDRGGGDAVELGEGADGVVPPISNSNQSVTVSGMVCILL